jgi:hypothetical protein
MQLNECDGEIPIGQLVQDPAAATDTAQQRATISTRRPYF